MAAAKKKRLPKDFEALLEEGDLAKLQAVFEGCNVDARGGYAKQTALAFDRCPDDLARWLVARGAELSARDTWGNTPLHTRARSWRGRIDGLLELGADVNDGGASIGTPLHAAADSKRVENAKQLLARGAAVDARNKEGLTPLELALRSCSNIEIERMVELARVLLHAEAAISAAMSARVEAIGKTFEFHREGFAKDSVDATSAALGELYTIFGVTPVPRRRVHDGVTAIAVRATRWQEQHQELWDLLVPSSGPAATVQGEVIRISGRIAHELEGNGGANWDADYKKMAQAFLTYVETGISLAEAEVASLRTIVRQARAGAGDTDRMAELAVAWVLQNPTPTPLAKPPYSR
jgi:hypothetical protein